jgi:membrane-bound lytic murein transglycosylase D
MIFPVMLILTGACRTTIDPSGDQTAPSLPKEERANATKDTSAEGENLPQARRYCRDDIFSLYLQASYLDRNDDSIPMGDKQQFRRLRKEAQHEAYRKLNMHLPVAFGGLPVQATQRVYSWIEYFTGNGRQEFLLWLVRSESFRQVVIPLLESEGLPAEFFFLAMIESGFSNLAYSRSSASGTWQFMKPTAKHYGLTINYWVDERRDPIKSTLAAARYLKDLNRQFRDWYLAMAAYNTGPNRVIRAMRASQSRDYWVLSRTPHLLPETKNYVPKLLAALIIASHPDHYGFAVAADIRNTTPMSTVALRSTYRLSEIAERLGIPVRELQRWNPELMRGITPSPQRLPGQQYTLRLPKPFAERFASIEGQLSQLIVQDVQIHRIQKGETLIDIARRYKISVQQLLQYNPDLRPQHLRPGQNVAVPVPAVVEAPTDRQAV